MTRAAGIRSTQSGASLIREMWPMRHDYFGVRLMLRSVIRMERKLRRAE